VPEHHALSLERDLFPRLIGHGLYAKHFDAAFIDIGTPASLQEAEGFFRGAR
jgi:NDP-sugar pyrophosphorylase family protein